MSSLFGAASHLPISLAGSGESGSATRLKSGDQEKTSAGRRRVSWSKYLIS
jgi:hypothetical protein